MDRPIGNTPDVHAECEKWYVDTAFGDDGITLSLRLAGD